MGNRPSRRFGKGNLEWKNQERCRSEGRSDARRDDFSTYRNVNPKRHQRLMRRNEEKEDSEDWILENDVEEKR